MRNRNCLLIVDDEPDIRLLLETCAEKSGFSPLLAENGRQALEMVQQYQPDAVISDIMMPEMDGMEFLRWMKSNEIDIPVILMTAYGTIDRAVEAMKSGAADFITKPVSPDYLMQVVRRRFQTGGTRAQTPRTRKAVEGRPSLSLARTAMHVAKGK